MEMKVTNRGLFLSLSISTPPTEQDPEGKEYFPIRVKITCQCRFFVYWKIFTKCKDIYVLVLVLVKNARAMLSLEPQRPVVSTGLGSTLDYATTLDRITK